MRAARDGVAGSWRRGAGFARRRSEAGRGEGRVKTNTLKGGEKGKTREKRGKKKKIIVRQEEGGKGWALRGAPPPRWLGSEQSAGMGRPAGGSGRRRQPRRRAAAPGSGSGRYGHRGGHGARGRSGGAGPSPAGRRGSLGQLQRALSGGVSAGSGDLRAPGGCQALGGRGSCAPISDLLRRKANPRVGFESSPLEAGATALRPRLLRKRRSGAERGNFVWERAALRGQRPGGGVRAPGNACFVVCKRRMDIKGHTDISRWI